MPQHQEYQDAGEQDDHRESNESLYVGGSFLKFSPEKIILPIVTTVVVPLIPRALADVAELITTGASHVIAAFDAFDELLAFGTPFPVFVEIYEVVFTVLLIVVRHHALAAVLFEANIADQLLLCHIEQSFALISGTQLQIRIMHSLFPQLVHFAEIGSFTTTLTILFRSCLPGKRDSRMQLFFAQDICSSTPYNNGANIDTCSVAMKSSRSLHRCYKIFAGRDFQVAQDSNFGIQECYFAICEQTVQAFWRSFLLKNCHEWVQIWRQASWDLRSQGGRRGNAYQSSYNLPDHRLIDIRQSKV